MCCSCTSNYRGSGKTNRTNEKYITPRQKEAKALSHYKTARTYEDKYYETKQKRYAITSIKRYREYYNLTPNGEYACLALLKVAELLWRIGNEDDAKVELSRVRSRRDFMNNLEDFIL